jgi:arsenate reductase
MIKIYGIKNCDTMKKAFVWLDKHKIKYSFHNYKESGIDAETIELWLKKIPMEQLINMKSTTWREQSEESKKSISNPKKAITMMMENTSVIKRPLVVFGKEKYLLGFKEEEWLKNLA